MNLFDLITLFKGLGYHGYKIMFWLDPNTPGMDFGLKKINEKCDAKMKNRKPDEIYIYFEHPILEAEIIELEDLVASFDESSSHMIMIVQMMSYISFHHLVLRMRVMRRVTLVVLGRRKVPKQLGGNQPLRKNVPLRRK